MGKIMKNRPSIDMSGKRFNKLIAIKMSGNSSASGDKKWIFKCDCGIEFEANGYYARCGRIISCQNCSRERTRLASLKHGLSDTDEFKTWTDMQSRCYNPNVAEYKNYGGRGIKICDKWLKSFSEFLNDMGVKPSKKHSIDRIDCNLDYTPENCKWATPKEQQNNRRNNIKITINGITKNLTEWCFEKEIPYSCVVQRYRSGKTGNNLFLPVRLPLKDRKNENYTF